MSAVFTLHLAQLSALTEAWGAFTSSRSSSLTHLPWLGGPSLLSCSPLTKDRVISRSGGCSRWLKRPLGPSSAHHWPQTQQPRPGSGEPSETSTNLFPSGSRVALKESRRWIDSQPCGTFGFGARVEAIPVCGGEMCLHIELQGFWGGGGVAAVNTKMSLRVVFKPGLKRTLLSFLSQRPEQRFPSALLSRGLTLAAQDNSRNGIPLPHVPGHDVPQRVGKAKHTLAPDSPMSVTIPSPGRQPPGPHFRDISCSRTLVRRPGKIYLDQHTDLGAHWSSWPWQAHHPQVTFFTLWESEEGGKKDLQWHFLEKLNQKRHGQDQDGTGDIGAGLWTWGPQIFPCWLPGAQDYRLHTSFWYLTWNIEWNCPR